MTTTDKDKVSFNVDIETIERLFSQKSIIYRVPKFQRFYSWTKDEIDTLLEDIYDANFLDKKLDNTLTNNYFLGSIVISGNNEKDILDGQQRLTTIILILAVIKAKLEKVGSSNSYIIEHDFLYSRDYSSGQKQLKLQLQKKDQDILENLVESPEKYVNNVFGGEYVEKAFGVVWQRLETLVRNIESRYEIPVEQILLKIFTRIICHVELVVIKAPSQKSAFQLFETLNNRGKDLTEADLIKNKLFAICANHDAHYDKVVETWQEITEDVHPDNMVDFLRAFYIASRGMRIRKKIYRQYSSWLDQLGVSKTIKLLERLRNVAKLYKLTFLTPSSKCLGDIGVAVVQRLKLYRNKSFFAPTIACFLRYQKLEIFQENFSVLIQLLETITVRYSIIGELRTSQLESAYVNLCKSIRDNQGKTIKEIVKLEFLSYVPDDVEFEQKFTKMHFNPRTRSLRAILSRINDYLSDKSFGKEVTLINGSHLHIEHILPQNPSKETLEESQIEQHVVDRLKNRIGNLTLLSGRKNQSISNRPYSQKADVYRDSAINITRHLVPNAISEQHKVLKSYEIWSQESIEHRSKELASIAVKIWCW